MRLTWYIIRMHIGPFLFGTSAVVFLFLLQFIFKYLNDLVGKGLSYWIIAKLIALNLAWMLVLAVPMGMLVATLMAYGKLSGSNELTIIKSAGSSAIRAMRPAIIGGALLFLALFLFNDKILPGANQRAMVLQNDIKQLKTTFAIEPGRFTTLQGYSILARRVNHDSNELLDVTIYGQQGEMMNVINAKRALTTFNQDYSRLVMDLHQGEVHQVKVGNLSEFRKFNFSQYRVAIPVSGYNFNQSDPSALGKTDRTMNISEMREVADQATSRSDRATAKTDSVIEQQFTTLLAPTFQVSGVLTRTEAAAAALNELNSVRALLEAESVNYMDGLRTSNQYEVEIQKKYSIPAACLAFVFVGAPLGILVRRGNFGVSAAIALGFFVIYWACLVTGEKLADRLVLSPAVAMWMADGVIGAMGLYLTVLVSRETVTFNFELPRWLRRRSGVGDRRSGKREP